MKKLFLTALCTTTIVYGGEAPRTSHALIVGQTPIEASRCQRWEWPTLEAYIKNGIEHEQLKKANHALQMQLYRQRKFLRSAVLIASFTTIFNVINIWKPTLFSENFSSLKQWKSTFSTPTAAKIDDLGKSSQPNVPTSIPTTPEKPQDQ